MLIETGTTITYVAQALREHRGLTEQVPAFQVAVRNTVGAGDGFVAAMASALAWSLSIQDALASGSAVAAVAVTKPGAPWASYPTLAEVSGFLRDTGNGEIFNRATTARLSGRSELATSS